MFYLLSFLINVSNLQPVVVKACVEVKESEIRSSAELAKNNLTGIGLVCEKDPTAISYACQSPEKGLVGKILVMKSKAECLAMPTKTSSDLKKLLNR